MIRTIAAASFLALAFGQSPTFEVASIKPTAPGGPGGRGMVGIQMAPGGRFNATGVTAKLLIGQAYDVRDFQISGGPGWMGSDRYDIIAKPENSSTGDLLPDPSKVTGDQMKTFQELQRLRLQALLADRFQLKIHRETKELPVYALVVGKGGPKLQESKADAPSSDDFKDFKGPDRSRGRGMRMGPGQLSGQMVQLPFLTQVLSQQLGRPVIDKTGLKGTYDFTLKFTPDQSQGGGGPFGDLPPGVKAPPPPDPNGPSIFTAVQEQLGLRLESQKGPVEILVIDHVEKPSEN
jgi:uncharacterized protein (TIGR03435 family)